VAVGKEKADTFVSITLEYVFLILPFAKSLKNTGDASKIAAFSAPPSHLRGTHGFNNNEHFFCKAR